MNPVRTFSIAAGLLALATVATPAAARQDAMSDGRGDQIASFRADYNTMMDRYEAIFTKLGNERGLRLTAQGRASLSMVGDDQRQAVPEGRRPQPQARGRGRDPARRRDPRTKIRHSPWRGNARVPERSVDPERVRRHRAQLYVHLRGAGGVPGRPHAPGRRRVPVPGDDRDPGRGWERIRGLRPSCPWPRTWWPSPTSSPTSAAGRRTPHWPKAATTAWSTSTPTSRTVKSDIIASINANTQLIINNDNTNRDLIIDNDNANREIVLTAMKNLSCDLSRLLHTPEGQRRSDIAECVGQPYFPYDFPIHP